MKYLEFRESLIDLVCFSVHQIGVYFPNFNQNNLTRWVKQGLLTKLRNGYYAFPEYQKETGASFYIANKIYSPSYISLHSALAFYGIIPEAIVQVTSITSLKTMNFENGFGSFSYKTVLPKLIFGQRQIQFRKDMTILIAEPEKAILDFFYLYTFYNTTEEISLLRFDHAILNEVVSLEKFEDYLTYYENNAVEKRIQLLRKEFDLC
jgi:predicted transcriptional regulator of viral defense system